MVPTAAERLLTREVARAYGDIAVYPERVLVDSKDSRSRRFPAWPGPVLVLTFARSLWSNDAG
jgi:hypothetical protein